MLKYQALNEINNPTVLEIRVGHPGKTCPTDQISDRHRHTKMN